MTARDHAERASELAKGADEQMRAINGSAARSERMAQRAQAHALAALALTATTPYPSEPGRPLCES